MGLSESAESPTLNPEGTLLFAPELRPLDWISPSRYADMRKCLLRELLLHSRTPELLPLAPAAHVGIAIHRMLYEAATTETQRDDHDWIRRRLDALIVAQEAEMARNWLERHLVPLRESAPQFDVRLRQAMARAIELQASRRPPKTLDAIRRPHFGNELRVQTRDGLIRGVIDAVVPSDAGPTLVEFKTGWLYDRSSGTLREAYRDQLLLYAAAYYETIGEWPEAAELVSVSGAIAPVRLSREAALELSARARDLLRSANERVAEGTRPELLANPSSDTCASCRYRPGCVAYRSSAEVLPTDRWGHLDSLTPVRDGTAVAVVSTFDGAVKIRSLTMDRSRHPALLSLTTRRISFFGLTQVGTDTFAQNQLTTAYAEYDRDGRTT